MSHCYFKLHGVCQYVTVKLQGVCQYQFVIVTVSHCYCWSQGVCQCECVTVTVSHRGSVSVNVSLLLSVTGGLSV